MSFSFRPAVRENVGLLIGLMGSSGSGKTYTAMRLAKGIAGGKPFVVIDTEAGRAKHYADLFAFDHGDLKPPFSPAAYADAIASADAAGYPVIVVDSFSHEHAGEGGILDMQEAEFQRMGGREAVKMASWIKPKMEHKRMVQRLLQVRAHLILCFRAEQKIEMVKENGQTKVVPKQSPVSINGWIPICEKNLPFELTASFLLTADKPGIPQPIKLQEQHRPIFPLTEPISEQSGARLAEWARGGTSVGAERQTQGQTASATTVAGTPVKSPAADSTDERADMLATISEMEDTLHLSGRDRRDLWTRYCGKATEHNVDLSALADLAADLRKRTKVEVA